MAPRRSIASTRSPFVHTWAFTAAAVALLAAVAFSSPARAASFTLAQLDAGADFTVGGLLFDNFAFDSFGSRNVNPDLIIITSIESSGNLAGIEVSGPMIGDDVTLQFDYTVSVLSGEDLSGALLWLADYNIVGTSAQIEANLKEGGNQFTDLNAFVSLLSEFPADSDRIIPLANSLDLRSELSQDLGTGAGFAQTGAFVNMFRGGTVIPEPGTALLMGMGLVGMGVRRRVTAFS